MKKSLILVLLVLFIAGCGKNNVEKATEYVLRTQKNENKISLIVFSDRTLEDGYVRELQAGINDLNNHVRKEDPVMNVSFINVKKDKNYNFEKVFNLQTYPRILVFQHNKVIMDSGEPQDIINFLKKKDK